MYKTIAAAIGLTLVFVSQCFAQTNIGIPKPNCTTQIMCCLQNGKCYPPSNPIGYTCNNGHAQTVTTCKTPPRTAK